MRAETGSVLHLFDLPRQVSGIFRFADVGGVARAGVGSLIRDAQRREIERIAGLELTGSFRMGDAAREVLELVASDREGQMGSHERLIDCQDLVPDGHFFRDLALGP